MMIYLQRNRPNKKPSLTKILVGGFVIFALVWVIGRFAGNFVSTVALNTGGPVASVYFGFKNNLSFARAFIQSRTSLIEENKKLQADIENNQAKFLRLDTLQREYDTLLASYNRVPSVGKAVLGNVVSKPPQSPYDVLVVDVGAEHGVTVGNRVYGVGGLPIGRVFEVTGTKSKVILFSSPGEKTEVIDERTGSAFTITGGSGGNLETEVAQDVDVSIGDNITLPEFGGAIVGTVVAVDTSVASSLKRILFRMPVNIFSIRWVEIVKD